MMNNLEIYFAHRDREKKTRLNGKFHQIKCNLLIEKQKWMNKCVLYISGGKLYRYLYVCVCVCEREALNNVQLFNEPNKCMRFANKSTFRLIMATGNTFFCSSCFAFCSHSHLSACAVIKFWSRFKLFTNIYPIVAKSTEWQTENGQTARYKIGNISMLKYA